MKKILFICHGNICRSTMAEFLFKHMVKDAGCTYADNLLIKDWRNDRVSLAEMQKAAENSDADFYIDSAATSREEIGEPVDRRTVAKLKEHGVKCGTHYARQVTKDDYEFFDLLILMDAENIRGIKRIIPNDPGNKIHLMMEFVEDFDIIKHNNDNRGNYKNNCITNYGIDIKSKIGRNDSRIINNNEQKLCKNNSCGIKAYVKSEEKQKPLLNGSAYTYLKLPRDVSDPWYTLDFEKTYQDLTVGLDGLMRIII